MRKVIKISVVAVCALVGAAILAVGALFLPPVREHAARRATQWLGEKFDATVDFERVRMKLSGEVAFDGLHMVDNEGDTLLSADVGARMRLKRDITVRRLAITDGQADIKQIISKLKGGGGRFGISALELSRMNIRYDTLAFDDVVLRARDLTIDGKDISVRIKKLRSRDKSLSCPMARYAGGVLTLDGTRLRSSRANLYLVRLRVDFATRDVDAEVRNSRLILHDIAVNELNINASGTFDDIAAQVSCGAGEATRLSTSGRWLRGGTFSLNLDSLATTAADAAAIARAITREPLPDTLTHMLQRLEPLVMRGDADGGKRRFTARATIATALGSSIANATLSDGKVVYGEVSIDSMDVGRLLAVDGLGRVMAAVTFTGEPTVSATFEIPYLEYKGHDYQHISGAAQVVDGQLSARLYSRAPELDFDLGVRAPFDLPARGDFDLEVTHADLRALRLNPRDPISRIAFAAHGSIGEITSATADHILYTNHLDTIQIPRTKLLATPGRVALSSGLNVASALVPGLDVAPDSPFTAIREGDLITFSARSPRIEHGGMAVSNIAIDGTSHADTLSVRGNIDVGQRPWNIGVHEAIPRPDGWKISGLTLESEGQRLHVNGVASRSRRDTLAITAENFDLSPLSDMLRLGHDIGGRASGRAILTAALARPAITAAIDLDGAHIGHVAIAPLQFGSEWRNELLHLSLTQNGTPVIEADYSPATRGIDGRIAIRNIDLSLLDAYYTRALSATGGYADLDAAITGTLGRGGLELSGGLLLNDYSAVVDFLGVRYAAAPGTRLRIDKNVIVLDSVAMNDSEGNRALLSGDVDLRKLKNVSYRFGISTPNILAMETTQADNSQFYGHLYAAGNAYISGGKQGVNLSVNVATQPGSSFFMPLNKGHDIADADFITFSDQSEATPATPRRKGRLNADMALAVGPETQIELLIDPKTGHNIEGRGNGLLNLHINPRAGEFSIYGDYRFSEGTYLFTLENIIERPFAITPGSTLRWEGDPLDARLDITAAYRLKTSVAPAVAGTGYDSWRMRIPIECRILLSERLSSPSLAFEIVAPNATPETQNILHTFLDTPEMTATQFFFLIATGNFYDYASGGADIGAAAGSSTAFDFLSNQLTGLIPTDRFTIGLRYRPQTETTSDEWGVDFTQQLWGERLLLEIEGNYDTRNNQSAAYTQNMRNFTGDLNLTGLIDRRGTLRAKIFTRTITRFDENQGLQESGAGVYFTEDFNTFGDIFRWLRPHWNNEKRKRNTKTAPRRERRGTGRQ